VNADEPGDARPLPAGTITLLFTDLEGSTRLLQALGEKYADVLSRCRQILRTAIGDAGGREVDVTGDGLFAAFPRARDAVTAAVAAQQGLAACAWPAGARVLVRMGLHTGEPTAAAGQYVGLDVHRAARIASAAHGGQVLVSEATYRLVENVLPEGTILRDLGWHVLKDLERPEHLFHLVVPGLPGEFPPLRGAAAPAGNLPAEPNEFIGRQDEVSAIAGLLRQQHVRLLTLTGPGGIGKTRLALHVAASLSPDFSDGVFWVPLATIRDSSLLTSSLATALGIRVPPTDSVLARLQDHLRPRRILLVLDNFEQLAGAGDDVAALLAVCPVLKALVTSRVLLRLSNEQAYEVPPLAVPSPDGLRTQDALARYSAVALFVERARAIRPGFALTEENARAVAGICARLDGLPLAIELAAARVRLLSPPFILARLGSRLDLLTGGARDLPERHRTLRGAVAWSYDLLSDDERAFFRRLSTFVGGCTLEAVAQVSATTGGPRLDPLEAVAALVDKSLVRQLDGPEGEARFGMLETIREFGLEELERTAELDDVWHAHAVYFLDLAERAEPELTGPGQPEWLDRLEADHDNFRAALAWAEEQGDAVIGLRLGAALWRFWVVRGHMQEGRRRLERLLGLTGAQERTATRARALHGLGTIIHEISDYVDARPVIEESLAIWRDLGHRTGIIAGLNSLGWLAAQQGDFDRSCVLSHEALELSRGTNERRGMALALHNLGLAAFQRGDYAAAVSVWEENLRLREAIGDRRGAAYVRIDLSWLELERGDRDRAARFLDEALATLRELNDKQLVSWALCMQGIAARAAGQLDAAKATLEEALRVGREMGNKVIIGWAQTYLGATLLSQGAAEAASAHLEQAVSVCRAIGSSWGLRRALFIHGQVAGAQGDAARALRLFQEGLALCQRMGARPGVAECLEAIAGLALSRGKPESAAELYMVARGLREAIGAPWDVTQVDAGLALARARLSDEAFSGAAARGRAMSLEEACRRALAFGVGRGS
jgi:predicted ATPase/class 3 adenylate cyclase